MKVLELENEALKLDVARLQKEILNGNFTLAIGDKLKMQEKIIKYASEPVSFHLHKKRDFI